MKIIYNLAMKITFLKLNHVQISIPPGQEEQARKFYKNILGLEEIDKPTQLKQNGGLWFNIANIQLHLGIEENQNRSKRHPAFEVENIDRIKEYLINNGIKIREEIQIPNMKRFSFFDPFDNRIELMELIKNQ